MPCSQFEEIFLRTSRFAFESPFCMNLSTQTGVRAATTAVSACSAASLWAEAAVIQPPHENPITMDATAPTATPCRRRVRDSPRSIEGTCMAFAFLVRGIYAARSDAGGARAERNSNLDCYCACRRHLCCHLERTETSVGRRFTGSSRTSHSLPLYIHMGCGTRSTIGMRH